MKDLTATQSLEAERKELNTLINRGMAFDVKVVRYERIPGILGHFRKRIKVTRDQMFKIEEPTLATLDRLSAEQIDLVIDENIMSSENGVTEARKLTHKHCRRLARIIAIAVLGSDYLIPIEGSHRYVQDDKKLKSLSDLFFHSIKPSKLMQLVVLINATSNLGDFCNSIRLMSAERTTMPIRIEAEEKD